MTDYANWVIWYSDGSSFSSLDGGPEDAPRAFVQCIAVARQSCGNFILSEQNYYAWHFDINEWVPHDYQGLMQYLMEPGVQKIVLQGYWTGRDSYVETRIKAQRDERLPKKTAEGPRQPEGQDGFI